MTLYVQYGIPLDSRFNYAKADWLMWVAAMGDSEQVCFFSTRMTL